MCPKKKERGAAMIIVACILAVILALSLSLLLAVSQLLAGTQSKKDDEQSRLLAVSLSQELERQLTRPTEEEKADGDALWSYLRQNVCTDAWPYYNEDERGHAESFSWRSFTVDTPLAGASAETELTMYWESDQEAEKDGTPLVIRVTCTVNGQSNTVTNEFVLSWQPGTSEPGDPAEEVWAWGLTWRE